MQNQLYNFIENINLQTEFLIVGLIFFAVFILNSIFLFIYLKDYLSQKKVIDKNIKTNIIDELKSKTDNFLLSRLKSGLSKTKEIFSKGIFSILKSDQIDDSLLEEIRKSLFKADLGVKSTELLVDFIKNNFKSSEISYDQMKSKIKEKIENILSKNQDFKLNLTNEKPNVILVLGVNGVGKTTTIGKLAAKFISDEKSVLLAAGDTFRAAAAEQLKKWAELLNIDIVSQNEGADPAAVAFDGVKSAISKKKDVLIVDTAGRLHNKDHLMEELNKIKKSISKALESAPHHIWLVIDATTGQNALQQIRSFKDIVDITGIILTKLDGTAKGGVAISIKNEFDYPICYIGVGEKIYDLQAFNPKEFADSLF